MVHAKGVGPDLMSIPSAQSLPPQLIHFNFISLVVNLMSFIHDDIFTTSLWAVYYPSQSWRTWGGIVNFIWWGVWEIQFHHLYSLIGCQLHSDRSDWVGPLKTIRFVFDVSLMGNCSFVAELAPKNSRKDGLSCVCLISVNRRLSS